MEFLSISIPSFPSFLKNWGAVVTWRVAEDYLLPKKEKSNSLSKHQPDHYVPWANPKILFDPIQNKAVYPTPV